MIMNRIAAAALLVLSTCLLAPGVQAMDVVDVVDDDFQDEDSRILMPRSSEGWMYQEPLWWPYVTNNFVVVNLKRCVKREFAPTEGNLCAIHAKTCYFGNQECADIGPYPTTECFCNGDGSSPGIWSCQDDMQCPFVGYPTQAPNYVYTPSPSSPVSVDSTPPPLPTTCNAQLGETCDDATVCCTGTCRA